MHGGYGKGGPAPLDKHRAPHLVYPAQGIGVGLGVGIGSEVVLGNWIGNVLKKLVG